MIGIIMLIFLSHSKLLFKLTTSLYLLNQDKSGGSAALIVLSCFLRLIIPHARVEGITNIAVGKVEASGFGVPFRL
jgi:hypothetical protein